MTTTLDVSIGGADANSYISLTDANSYFTNHYDTGKNTSWSGLSTAAKEQLLRTATLILDTIRFWDVEEVTPLSVEFFSVEDLEGAISTPYNDHQARRFPRNKDIDELSVAYIPQEVKWAECEQAIYMARTLDEDLMALQMQGVTSDSVSIAGGPAVRQTYSGTAPNMISPIAWGLVRRFAINKTKTYRA